MGKSQQQHPTDAISLKPKVDVSWLGTVVFSASEFQYLLEPQEVMLECKSHWNQLPQLNLDDQQERGIRHSDFHKTPHGY